MYSPLAQDLHIIKLNKYCLLGWWWWWWWWWLPYIFNHCMSLSPINIIWWLFSPFLNFCRVCSGDYEKWENRLWGWCIAYWQNIHFFEKPFWIFILETSCASLLLGKSGHNSIHWRSKHVPGFSLGVSCNTSQVSGLILGGGYANSLRA